MTDSDIWLTTGYLLRSRSIVPPGTRVHERTARRAHFPAVVAGRLELSG